MRRSLLILLILLAGNLRAADTTDGNRLAYLDSTDPYAPGLGFARLTTPQWVGEPGVEAVVVLAIDDMRDPAKYEAYLRPILDRLKAIDGRAPVSIMTCRVDPADPQLGRWLTEGLNLDVHTISHPCPLLQKGDFPAARSTVHDCVDLLHKVPGNRPVAFRMPCCDSLNTPSPRFYSAIFDAPTPAGHFLTIDSSVFNILTPDDPGLPRRLVVDADGGERFRKYLPFKSFVNTIENYPYPYVIGGSCWEFPCVVPSDWEAQNLQKPNNPRTVADLKAALDAIVLKQGVFNLVFHPHGWIKSEQVVELIDHAVATHGTKVKFLNLAEAQARLDAHLLGGEPIRDAKGLDNGVRILDVDNDGFMDVVIGNERVQQTRVWEPSRGAWRVVPFPTRLRDRYDHRARFGVVRADGKASVLVESRLLGQVLASGAWSFDGGRWAEEPSLRKGLEGGGFSTFATGMGGVDKGVRLRDIDGDGRCELIAWTDLVSDFRGVFTYDPQQGWTRKTFGLPGAASVVMTRRPADDKLVELDDIGGQDAGLRFVDIDEDGALDVVTSNDRGFGVYLFESMAEGWSRRVTAGAPGDPGALPPIVRVGGDAWRPRVVKHEDGTATTRVGKPTYVTDNGFWVHSRHLWWQNEDTAGLPDLVDRRSFNDLLKDVPPRGKSAAASLRSIRVRPGFRVELAASEPLVQDPIAFDWSADGRLWVVEMGDYPLGIDGKGRPGGRIRVLDDDDGDGRYDRATTFVSGLEFPTGVMPWRKGVLIAAAPVVFYAEDRDGDGVADHADLLFSGFNPGNQQHRANGFEAGLDGWIYGANGDSGGVVRSARTGRSVDIRGRDFRFDPDTGAFETESGMTQFGRHRDDWGRWFGNNNPTWGWVFMLDEAALRRNPSFAAPDPRKTLEPDTRLHPVAPIAARFNDLWAAGRVTSANSITPYRDDLFGPAFADSLFVSDPVHNLVHRMVVEPDGPGLKGRRAVGEADREFLASSDPWFRPTMLKTGPDGALWVCDMDRAVIEHPEWIPDDWEAKLDLRAGHDRGRIFRVVPVDQPTRRFERLDTLDDAGLVAALESPNGWRRDTAQRLLRERGARHAAPLLRRLAATTERPNTRVQALWTLANLGAIEPADVAPALRDAHPQVRRQAVALSERWLGTSPDIVAGVARLAADEDPAVRYQVALSLGAAEGTVAADALASIARRDGSDPWFRAAVLCSAPNHVGTLLARLLEDGGSPPEALAGPLFALAWRPSSQARIVEVLGRLAAPAGAGGRFERWQFAAFAGLAEASRRSGRTLEQRFGDDGQARPILERLGAIYPAVRAVVRDPDAGEPDRLAALAVFGLDPRQADAEREALAALLNPRTPAGLQREALRASGRGRDPKLPAVLLAGWAGHAPGLRSSIVELLLGREEWAAALLSSLEDTCVPPAEIDPSHRRRLLDHPSPALRDRAAAVFGPRPGAREPVVALYREGLKAPGDPAAGEAVFRRACATCHRLGGVGNDVGPDLATLTDRSPDALLAAILDPNRAVESKYMNFSVALTDGRVLTGIVASESAASITLRREEGKEDVVPRAEIEAMVGSGQSLMPEGLEKDLTPRDLADLIEFLNRPASPPATATPGGGVPCCGAEAP